MVASRAELRGRRKAAVLERILVAYLVLWKELRMENWLGNLKAAWRDVSMDAPSADYLVYCSDAWMAE